MTFSDLIILYIDATESGEMCWESFSEESPNFNTSCYRSDLADPNKEVVLKKHADREAHYLVSLRYKDEQQEDHDSDTAIYEEVNKITGERLDTIDHMQKLWELIEKST